MRTPLQRRTGRTPDSDVSALLETIRDLRLQLEEGRAVLDERLEADRRKDEFLAVLSHELRNPLAPIRSAARVLSLRASSDPEAQRCREIIDRQVGQMANLLDDLLDVSRISQGRLQVRKHCVSLTHVLSAAIETSRPWIEARRHRLTVTLPDGPVMMNADPVRLSQVFTNLLNNAAKYTDPGGRIEVAAVEKETQVMITIRDNGIGLGPESLQALFGRFPRTSRDRSDRGLGVGLSLVRELVHLHEGQVEASSDGPGQGSLFTVRLPLANTKPVPAYAPAGVPARSRARKLRVLVVDDTADVADSLTMVLEAMGHEVATAYDGATALSEGRRLHPEAVLLDLGMPHPDGYETCRSLRSEPWGQGAHVVAVTGWGQEWDKRRTKEAGFDRHLVKPVEIDQLTEILASLP